MPLYEITYRNGTTEQVEADDLREERAHLVLIKTVLVAGLARTAVVRRLAHDQGIKAHLVNPPARSHQRS